MLLFLISTSGKKNLSNAEKFNVNNKKKKYTLDCGKVVNYTEYDKLRGIANRHNHPHVPEPEVAMIFRKKGLRNTEVDMNELEKRLKKSKKEVFILLWYMLLSLFKTFLKYLL